MQIVHWLKCILLCILIGLVGLEKPELVKYVLLFVTLYQTPHTVAMGKYGSV